MNNLDVLGVVIGAELSLEPMLARVCAKLHESAWRLVAGLADHGFGMPLQAEQLPGRAEASAFHGAELLASHARGWNEVAAQLDRAGHDVAKAMLGLPPAASFGTGGYVRLFLETRLLTRASAKVPLRISI